MGLNGVMFVFEFRERAFILGSGCLFWTTVLSVHRRLMATDALLFFHFDVIVRGHTVLHDAFDPPPPKKKTEMLSVIVATDQNHLSFPVS